MLPGFTQFVLLPISALTEVGWTGKNEQFWFLHIWSKYAHKAFAHKTDI